MLAVYRTQFGGQHACLPEDTGKAFLLKLGQTVMQPGEEKLLQCPLEGDYSDPQLIDYRGPSRNVNRQVNFRSVDPIVGDDPDNHGDRRRHGVQVLTKGHQVLRILETDVTEWANYMAKTSD
jgi:hypothetical protein